MPRERERVDVFLCHNSLDKPVVRQVSEGLELEFGIPHFLDVDAIPAGEEFIPWIEKAMAESRGCAIFLGANGWGPTHLWEAERALERYRKDPAFRLIPVALPGIWEVEMRRLGEGTLFSEINWADFRNGPVDTDAIHNLRTALLGRNDPAGPKPSKLTPCIVRREAARWEQSARRDSSILYRGRQLEAALKLRKQQPDLMGGDAISYFLTFSANAVTRRAIQISAVSIVALAVIAVLAVLSERSRRLATSRFIAAEARQEQNPDDGLLLAIQATRVWATAEAFGAMIDRLDAMPHVARYLRVAGASVTSLAFAPDNEVLYAGLGDGRILRFNRSRDETVFLEVSHVAGFTALAATKEGELWIGDERGGLTVRGVDGRIERIDPPVCWDTNAPSRPDPILSMQVDLTGRLVAVSSYRSRVLVVDRATRKPLWCREMERGHIPAIAFSYDSTRLAAGSSHAIVDILVAATGESLDTLATGRSGGNPVAVQYDRWGSLQVIDNGPAFWVRSAKDGQDVQYPLPGEFLSAAVIGPRQEFDPILERRLFVLGYGAGDVAFKPFGGDSREPIVVHGHGASVQAVAISDDGTCGASASVDGSIAVWNLQKRSTLVQRVLQPIGSVRALAYEASGSLLAVTSSEHRADVVRLGDSGWVNVMPLEVGAAIREDQAAEVGVDSVGLVRFDRSARKVSWVTRHGAVYASALGAAALPKPLHRGEGIFCLSIDDDGKTAFVADSSNVLWYLPVDAAFPPRRIQLNEPARALAAGKAPGTVDVALDDGTVQRFEFDASPDVRRGTKVQLGGAAGLIARMPQSEAILAAGAGSTAGTRFAFLDSGKVKTLASRRIGGSLSTLAISDSVSLIAAGDHAGVAQLWDLHTLVPIATLHLSDIMLTAVAISPDGQRMAFASLDNDVYEMSLDVEAWRQSVCEIVRHEQSADRWDAVASGMALRPTCRSGRG